MPVSRNRRTGASGEECANRRARQSSHEMLEGRQFAKTVGDHAGTVDVRHSYRDHLPGVERPKLIALTRENCHRLRATANGSQDQPPAAPAGFKCRAVARTAIRDNGAGIPVYPPSARSGRF
jgi:hypothetical protein